MRHYEGWRLTDRSFTTAVVLSVLWHLFWFFTITVNVNPMKRYAHMRPKMVAFGPVMEDTIFRTLAQNKPQNTQTFYRRMSDFETYTASQVKMLGAGETGRVVSLPQDQAQSALLTSDVDKLLKGSE